VGISQDYPIKTQTSKQSIGEIPRFKIIPFHPLKYPRSKQGLRDLRQRFGWTAPLAPTRAVSLRAWSCPSVTTARRRQLILVFVQNLHGCRQREFRLHACDWGEKSLSKKSYACNVHA
jgi:hypothetical protein